MTLVGTQNQSNREVWLEQILKSIPVGSRILYADSTEQKYKKNSVLILIPKIDS